MATIEIDGDRVVVTLTAFEKVAGLLRDQTIPLRGITAVAICERPIDDARGLRSPGLGIPGRSKIGTWRRRGRREFVRARHDQPAVDLEVTGERYDRYLISTPDAADVVARIRAARWPASGDV